MLAALASVVALGAAASLVIDASAVRWFLAPSVAPDREARRWLRVPPPAPISPAIGSPVTLAHPAPPSSGGSGGGAGPSTHTSALGGEPAPGDPRGADDVPAVIDDVPATRRADLEAPVAPLESSLRDDLTPPEGDLARVASSLRIDLPWIDSSLLIDLGWLIAPVETSSIYVLTSGVDPVTSGRPSFPRSEITMVELELLRPPFG